MSGHTPGRIDRAIAGCEQIETDGLNGKFKNWAAFKEARDAAEREYRAALAEWTIRSTREELAIARASGDKP